MWTVKGVKVVNVKALKDSGGPHERENLIQCPMFWPNYLKRDYVVPALVVTTGYVLSYVTLHDNNPIGQVSFLFRIELPMYYYKTNTTGIYNFI